MNEVIELSDDEIVSLAYKTVLKKRLCQLYREQPDIRDQALEMLVELGEDNLGDVRSGLYDLGISIIED